MYNTMQYPFVKMLLEGLSPEAVESLEARANHRIPDEDDVFSKLRDRFRELYDSAEEIREDDSGEDVDTKEPFGDLPAGPDSSTYTIETRSAFPKISRVVFNEPVTKVWFEDGTTSMVRASKDDTFSKEAGLAFAIVKRLYGTPDDRGNYGSAGYMMELKRIVDKAYDQTPITKKRNAEKATRKKAKEKADVNSKNISNGKPGGKSRTGRKRSR